MKTTWNALLAALVLAFGVVGCTPQAQEKYDAAGDAAANAADKAGEAAATDAKAAGEAIEDSAEKAAETADATETTGKVKSAILAADNLEAKDLNVDTVGKTVTLKGSVPTADMKARAESIAKGIVGSEYTVVNNLTVGGATNTP